MQDTWIWFLGQEDTLEKEMATHSSILTWEIPWTEEPSRLESVGLEKSRKWLSDKTTKTILFSNSILTEITYEVLFAAVACYLVCISKLVQSLTIILSHTHFHVFRYLLQKHPYFSEPISALTCSGCYFSNTINWMAYKKTEIYYLDSWRQHPSSNSFKNLKRRKDFEAHLGGQHYFNTKARQRHNREKWTKH